MKPWVAAAALLAVVLLGYYGLLGVRYWQATQQVASADTAIRRTTRALRGEVPDGAALAAELEAQKRRLAEVRGVFAARSTDAVLAALSGAAQEAGVALASVSLSPPRAELRDPFVYQAQPALVLVQGQTTDIYRFLEALHRRVPVADVTGVTLGGLDSSPAAQVQLLLYLEPQPVPEKPARKEAR